MIPVTRKDKDDLQELKKEIETLKATKQEVENQQQTKMSDLIKQIKDRDEQKKIDDQKKAEEVKKIEEHVHDDAAFCPTCQSGHIHKIAEDKTGLVWKCDGDKCGYEAVLVDKTSDFKCLTCNAPIKKPVNDNIKLESCPFCHGKKSVRFDWGKLWNVKKDLPKAK